MEQRVLDQVRWLNTHGHAVWLATPDDGEAYRRAQSMNLPVIAMSFDPPWRPSTLSAMRRLVQTHGIDIIDTHVTRDAKAAMSCLNLCAVVRSRHVNQYLKPSLLRRKQWRWGADHVITVAEVTRANLIASGLADAERSTSIGGWADDAFFLDPSADRRGDLRRRLGIRDDQPVIVCVGMLRPDKGQNHLLNALAILAQQGHKPVCLLAGSTTAESAAFHAMLRKQAVETETDVRFLGYIDDVAELLHAADLMVLPSLTEAQPRAIVQAFAAGCPVVATTVGGIPEIVKEGVTGWLVPPAAPIALAKGIARVLTAERGEIDRVTATARDEADRTMRFDDRMRQTLETYAIAMNYARSRPFIRVAGLHPRPNSLLTL